MEYLLRADCWEKKADDFVFVLPSIVDLGDSESKQ